MAGSPRGFELRNPFGWREGIDAVFAIDNVLAIARNDIALVIEISKHGEATGDAILQRILIDALNRK